MLADHMLHISNSMFDSGVDDEFLDTMLFVVDVVPEWYFGVSEYLFTGKMPTNLTKAQQKRLVIQASSFTIIRGMLYKLCRDELLQLCVMPHKVRSLI